MIKAVKPLDYIAPRHWPTWLGIGLLRISVLLPLPVLILLGKVFGKLLYILLPERRTVADINLKIAFPDAAEPEILRMRKLCFENMGIALFELGLSWWENERLLKFCEVEGLEHITEVQQQGRGVIILTAHFTCLEVGGPVLNHYVPFQVMYKRAHNPLFDAFMRYHRGRLYKAIVDHHKPMAMIRGLRKGNAAWYAPDQDFRGKDMVYIPFFGVQASALTAPARFAEMTHAAVVPYYIQRKADGRGYRLVVLPALENFPGEDTVSDAIRINQALEHLIMQNPEQYLWIHKRYKNRPEGEPALYPAKPKKKK